MAKYTHFLNREKGTGQEVRSSEAPNKFCLVLKRMYMITKSDTEIYLLKEKNHVWFPFSSEAHVIIIETRMDIHKVRFSLNKRCGKLRDDKMFRLQHFSNLLDQVQPGVLVSFLPKLQFYSFSNACLGRLLFYIILDMILQALTLNT